MTSSLSIAFTVMCLVILAQAAPFDLPASQRPGSPAKAFSFTTLSGSRFNYVPSSSTRSKSIIFSILNAETGMTQALVDDISSIKRLVLHTPENVTYVFASWGPNKDARGNWLPTSVYSLKENFVTAMYGLGFTSEATRDWLNSRTVFINETLSNSTNWVNSLATAWPTVAPRAQFNGVEQSFARLDANYDWLPNVGSLSDPPLASFMSNDCSPGDPSLNGTIAVTQLIQYSDCSVADLVYKAQKAGAVALVVYPTQNELMSVLNCHNATQCDYPLNIPLTMIPWGDGTLMKLMLSTGQNVQMNFFNSNSTANNFAIDRNGDLQEVGAMLYPDMQFLVWGAQTLQYILKLEHELVANNDTVIVPILSHGSLGPHNSIINFTATLPHKDIINKFGKAELEARLECGGPTDRDCPPWDRTLQLFVQCGSQSKLLEIARWVTPFQRRIGHWLTDISPLVPLLYTETGTCHFQLKMNYYQSDGTVRNSWVPSFNLRLSDKRGLDVAPSSIVPLFQGGFFNSHYNERSALAVNVPDTSSKVLLVSLITGHGSDENQCAEFCVTSHEFTVNDFLYSETFLNAGTQFGCANRVAEGSVGNEYGTWLFGRNGWCDGENVRAWNVDVTDKVTPSTKLTYQGLYQGASPTITTGDAMILMESYLVIYE